MKFAFSAAVLLLVSGVAVAQDNAPIPGQTAQAQSAPNTPDEAASAPIVVEGQKEKKICRTETATGSIMPKRVCKTASQIAQEQAQAQRALDAARADREGRDLTGELRNAAGL